MRRKCKSQGRNAGGTGFSAFRPGWAGAESTSSRRIRPSRDARRTRSTPLPASQAAPASTARIGLATARSVKTKGDRSMSGAISGGQALVLVVGGLRGAGRAERVRGEVALRGRGGVDGRGEGAA